MRQLVLFQDEVIQRFEDRCTEAKAEIQQLKAALQDTSKRWEAADARLASTMESRNQLKKQLEAKQAGMTSALVSLQAENEVLKVCSYALPVPACRQADHAKNNMLDNTVKTAYSITVLVCMLPLLV